MISILTTYQSSIALREIYYRKAINTKWDANLCYAGMIAISAVAMCILSKMAILSLAAGLGAALLFYNTFSKLHGIAAGYEDIADLLATPEFPNYAASQKCLETYKIEQAFKQYCSKK